MADWNKPTISSNYATEFIQEIDGRLDESAKMDFSTATNLPTNAIRYNRTTDLLEEWNGASWVTAPIDDAGLAGLGTMATQNANAVAITGGSMSGVNLSASDITAGTLNAARLADSGATPATYGDGSNVPVITVDAKGRITTITTTPAGAAGVPSGLIAIFDTSCPSGWTRVAAFDSKFLYGGASYGATGGESSHNHTADSVGDHQHSMGHSHPMSHGHGNTLGVNNANINPAGGYHDEGDGTHGTFFAVQSINTEPHGHGMSGGVSNFSGDTGMTTATYTGNGGAHTPVIQSKATLPPYITVVFCKKN